MRANIASSRSLSLEDKKKFTRLQLFRAAIAVVLILFISTAVEFGMSTSLLVLATFIGGFISAQVLKAGKTFGQVFLWHLGLGFVLYLSLKAVNFILLSISSNATWDFFIPRLSDDLFLLAIFYAAGLLSTWFFWTKQQAVSIEGLLSSAALVWLLSGHRNYSLDAPKQISSLSWKIDFFQRIGAGPQHLILGLGAVFVLLLAAYFVLSANRPLFGEQKIINSVGPKQKILAFACPLIVLLSLFSYARYLSNNYAVDLGRASNGVAPDANTKQGDSNLGFNSAVTATKQPSALLRLENDYPQNPWAPMLYLREGALSQFNGKEIVRSASKFNTDIPNIGFGQSFAATDLEPGENRKKVVQSIYVIGKQAAPFGIDVPKRIRAIKNPKPERFKTSYQVLSHALTIPLYTLVDKKVGDENWDEETWRHYTEAPGNVEDEKADSRYQELSSQLTDGVENPIIRAVNVTEYLSKNSIYTRSPGHQVTEDGDPVAPYLFGEKKRGYCVHFAHAAVYLMRLAGIPARIATGYQTDTRYAKDGHILLMMGDRHAWPEIYVRDYGWVVIDITPAEAENEPELIPDESLLEQLMSEIDPAPQFTEAVPIEDESTEAIGGVLSKLLNARRLIGIGSLALLALILFKLYLLYGYRLASDPRRRTKLAYTAVATRLADLGVFRNQGETRQEFCKRVNTKFSLDTHNIVSHTERVSYAKEPKLPDSAELINDIATFNKSCENSFSSFRRYISLLNPFSVFGLRSL